MSRLGSRPPDAFPKRFAVLFMGNGVNEDHWGSEGSGAEMKLSKTLEPLEPLKHKINVIHGLFHKRAMGQGIHPAQTGCLLSGAMIQKGAIVKAGITIDQMLANRIGQDTAQPSIVLACEQRDDRFPRDQLLAGLQFAPVLAERRIRRCRTKSIRRWPGTTCSRTAAACAT